MKNKLHIQLSPTRLKQIKKIALSGSKAKLKILNGKLEQGFHLLKNTAQKLQSFSADLAKQIPSLIAKKVSLDLFSHFESKNSKKLGIPKGLVLGGALALMTALPVAGQVFIDAPTTIDLVNAINTANGNAADHVIRLDEGQTYTLTANLPTVANNGTLSVICTGTINAIVDGDNSFRPFTMATNSNLTLSKITVQNGSAINGGGIYNYRGDLTIISNSLITNNKSTGVGATGGAGIYSNGAGFGASVFIQNSTISINSATARGGGIYNKNNSTLKISNSTISNNTSNTTGGGVWNFNSNLMISSSTISGNISTLQAGGIINYVNSTMTISCSTISGNISLGVGVFGGGGIYNRDNSSAVISNSTISGNTSASGGGGIYSRDNSPITISNSTISGNTSVDEGGGIYNKDASNLNISSSTISGNISSSKGGAIYNYDNSPLTITCSTISGNTAPKGGGIYHKTNTLTINNSLITNNQATGVSPSGRGAGIYSTGTGGVATILIQNSIISLNSATRGGGIFNRDNSSITISSSSISENTSNDVGGGLSNSFLSPLTILSSSISKNTSTSDGAGIFNSSDSFLTVSYSLFSGNISNNNGGAIANYRSNITIQASSIITNIANNIGGAMAITGDSAGGKTTLLQNTTISKNASVNGTGGGIYHDNNSGVANNITLQHVTLFDNTGVGTDGFANTGAADITVQNTIIDDCSGTGFDFSLGGGTLNAASTNNIVQDGSMAGAMSVHSMLNPLTLNSGSMINPMPIGSPAIAGGANLGIITDQVGNPRGATPSIGAVEVTVPGACMVVAAPAGVTNTWIGCTNTDWQTAGNWSANCVPKETDIVYVPQGTANELIIDEIAVCAKMLVQIGAKCKVDFNVGGKLLVKFQ